MTSKLPHLATVMLIVALAGCGASSETEAIADEDVTVSLEAPAEASTTSEPAVASTTSEPAVASTTTEPAEASIDFTTGSATCLPEQTTVLDKEVVVYMGDGEGLGYDPTATRLVIPPGSTLSVRPDDSSTSGDLDGDGKMDTVQFLDLGSPEGEHLAEGIRICETSRPLKSYFVSSSNGNFGALVVSFPDSVAGIVNRGPTQNLSPADVWLFNDDGYLIPPYGRTS